MNRKSPTIYRKIKAAVLLLALFFMVVNSCPIRSLLKSAGTTQAEFSKHSNSDIIMYDDLRCSESKITKASLLDFSNLSNNNLPLPLFLTVVSLYLSLSILSSSFRSYRKTSTRSLTNSVPLFLQNRSIII